MEEYIYDNVKSWTNKVPNHDVFALKNIVMPVNCNGTHWICIAVHVPTRRICHYDSMGGKGIERMKAMLNYLEDEWKSKGRLEKSGETFDRDSWTLVPTRRQTTPQQMNAFDCGVFTCAFAECLSRGIENFDFQQTDVTRLRKGIALAILKGAAIEMERIRR
jgi:sentrin-specific protease 1